MVPDAGRLAVRWVAAALVALGLAGCSTSSPPPSPTGLPPEIDPGPAPPIPTTDGATITLTAAGASPAKVRVFEGSRVTFRNADSSVHEILSDPVHVHTDCPAVNAVGFLSPGQTGQTGPLPIDRPCGFHDHVNENNTAFYGTIFIDPR